MKSSDNHSIGRMMRTGNRALKIAIIICFIAILAVPTATAFADVIDWPSLSEAEITVIINEALQELFTRQMVEENNIVLSDDSLRKELAVYQSINPDVIGILSIPGAGIFQPILQHSSEDNYYLTHNIYDSNGSIGTVWTNLCEGKTFSTFNTVIYGRNSDSLFRPLLMYCDKEFLMNNRTIIILDEKKEHHYDICAAVEYDDRYITYVYDDQYNEDCSAYLRSLHNDREGTFWVKDVIIGMDDHILTLSTNYIDKDQDLRFLLIAVEQ